jgi:hypothetical protein
VHFGTQSQIMAPQGNSDDLQRICTYVTLKIQFFVGLIDGVRESAQSWRVAREGRLLCPKGSCDLKSAGRIFK